MNRSESISILNGIDAGLEGVENMVRGIQTTVEAQILGELPSAETLEQRRALLDQVVTDLGKMRAECQKQRNRLQRA